MSWVNAGIAGGSALVSSGVLGGGGQEHIGTDEYYADWLQGDVKELAQRTMDLQTPEYYQGNTLAGQNPMMQGSLQSMYGWGQPGGMGNTMMNNIYNQGNQAFGQGIQGGLDYLQGMQARGPNQFQFGQGTYDQIMGNLTPGVQNMFDANAGSMQRNFDFNTLPGLKMQDAMGGGYGGTAGGKQSALASALNAGNIQQMGTSLWNNAANQATAGGMSAGGQNLASANAFDTGMMSNYGKMGQMGANMLNSAYDMGTNNMALGQDAARIQQAYDQSVIDHDKARWDYEQNAPWKDQELRQGLMQSWNGGGNPYTSASNGWTDALSGAQAGLGLWDAWNSSQQGTGGADGRTKYGWENMSSTQFEDFLRG